MLDTQRILRRDGDGVVVLPSVKHLRVGLVHLAACWGNEENYLSQAFPQLTTFECVRGTSMPPSDLTAPELESLRGLRHLRRLMLTYSGVYACFSRMNTQFRGPPG